MLAMALFFAACAGDDGNPGDPAEKPGQQVVDGYVKVAINMPTSSGLTWRMIVTTTESPTNTR